MVEEFDLVVLGGGNAVKVAIEAGAAGSRTALIEEGPLGGTCPNRGCIPTKLLIGYADRANDVRTAGRFHVDAALNGVSGEALLAETFASTRKTDASLARALPDGVSLLRGRGRFVGERTLEALGRTVRGERVVVATGGRPRRPDETTVAGLAGTPYWTSRDVFDLADLPASIAIVGGGYIACELGHFFHGVGVETTLLVRRDVLLPAEDDEVRRVFQNGFTETVPTLLDTQIRAVSHDGSRFHLQLAGPEDGPAELSVEALLFAIGRVPNTDGIGLGDAGIETDARGHVVVDDHLRTSAAGVYAMGDVTGGHQFTHTAAFEAQYLGGVLLRGDAAPLDLGPVPHAVFSSPEVAGVGATEQELNREGREFVAASVPFTSAAKGRAVKEAHGLCKFLLDREGTILGCHIVGHAASVLVHEVIPVMKWRNHISSLTDIIHIHPALSEVVRNAARTSRRALAS